MWEQKDTTGESRGNPPAITYRLKLLSWPKKRCLQREEWGGCENGALPAVIKRLQRRLVMTVFVAPD